MVDRRHSRRFTLGDGWEVYVRGAGRDADVDLQQTGTLANLSSTGALLLLSSRMSIGEKVELTIKLPLIRKRSMSYSGEVVRVERMGASTRVAIRFDHFRPSFTIGDT